MKHSFKTLVFARHYNGLICHSPGVSIDFAYRPTAPASIAAHTNAAMHNKSGLRILHRCLRVVSVFLTLFAVAPGALANDEVQELQVEEIAPGVFVHQGVNALMVAANGGAVANVGFVVGDMAVAVIDTGGSRRQGEALIKSIEKRTPLPIRWVINTHMHPDHVFGNAAFMGRDVAFVGHARLPEALKARFGHYLQANRPAMGDRLLEGTELVLPTVTVEDTLTLDLGGRTLTLKAWPVAHTDNDLTVLDDKSGTLFAGDLLFLQHLPSIDGSLRGWQRAIEGLAALPATRVVPGHGPIDSPWPAALEPERRYFDRLAGDLKASIDAGVPLGEAVKTAGQSERDNWFLFDEFNVRNATAGYAELEWE